MSISGENDADEVRLFIRRPDFGDGFEARVMCKDRVTGKVYAVHQYQMQQVDPGHVPMLAVLRLDAGSVQILMDDLWAAGVRPSRSVSRDNRSGTMSRTPNRASATVAGTDRSGDRSLNISMSCP